MKTFTPLGGIQRKKDSSKLFPPPIFKSLKSTISTFNCNFEEIFREFKVYFEKDLNIQF